MDTPLPAISAALDDVIEIAVRELGASRAAHVVGAAAINAVQPLLAPKEAVNNADDPARAAQQVWWKLWEALARERPEAFLPSGRRLTADQSGPNALAFAYARRREPGGLTRLQLSAAERRDLHRGRRALYAVTGLRSLRQACYAWVCNDNSLALRNTTFMRGAASAFPSAALLRRHILVRGEYVAPYRSRPYCLESLILHEELHVAVAETANWRDNRAITRPLVAGLQEPAAVLGEQYVEYLLGHDTPPSCARLKRLTAEHPDAKRAHAMLRLCPPTTDAADAIRLAVRVAVVAIDTDDDAQLADKLTLITSRVRTVNQLRKAFG